MLAVRLLLLGYLMLGCLPAPARLPAPMLLAACPAPVPGDSLIPYRKGTRWGYAAPNRRLVIAPQYTYAERFDHGLARVWLGQKCGLIDAAGRVVIPIRFDRVGYYQPASPRPGPGLQELASPSWPGGHGWVVVMRRDSLTPPVRARPEEDEPALPPWFDLRWATYPGTDHWGLYDSLGRVVLPLDYAFLARRADGLLEATRVADYFSGGVSEGEHRVYYQAFPLYEQLLFTTRGRSLLRGHAYTSLGDIIAGQLVAYVSHYPHGHWGGEVLVDTATGLATDRQYGRFEWLGQGHGFAAQVFYQGRPNSIPYPSEPPLTDEHHMAVTRHSEAVWLKPDEQPRTPQQYLGLWPAGPDRAIAVLPRTDSLPSRAGVLNLATGAWAIAPRYEEIARTAAGTYLVRERQRWGLLSAAGRWLVPPRYEGWRAWAGWPDDKSLDLVSTVLVRQAGRWGVLDVRGRERIAPAYAELEPTPGGYRAARVLPGVGQAARRWGVLTTSGRVRVPLRYERLERCQTMSGQALPYWQAWQAGRTLLLTSTGRVLLAAPGQHVMGRFYRGRALLKDTEYDSYGSDKLGIVELGPGGQARRQPLPGFGRAAAWTYGIWHDAQGRRFSRFRAGQLTGGWSGALRPGAPRPPGPYGLLQFNPALDPEMNDELLTPADVAQLTPPCYDDLEPQPEDPEVRTIGPYLRVRQGNRLGVLSTTGQLVVPVRYADVLWPVLPYQAGQPVGQNGVFWVRPPGGTWQAVGPGGRVLRDTGSARPPQLPYRYEGGYGLLIGSGEADVVGYVDAVGNPFFEDAPARPAPRQRP